MRTFYFFLIGSVALFAIFFMKQPSTPVKGDLLLTYPRSGTNWTIGIMQAFFKRPVRFIENPKLKEHLGVNRLGVDIDQTLPTLYRSHDVNKLVKKIDQSKFRLLFTLRNFKECIVKEYQLSEAQFLEALKNPDHSVEMYFDNLRFFDSTWKDPQTKHLIIYEEIISTPEKVIGELLTFFGGNLEALPEFFEGYDEWNQKMLTSYHKQHADKGKASNNEPLFHSKSFSKEALREVDALVEARYPDLWNKYLYRYKESGL